MKGIKVFISYSHKDEHLRDELGVHLKPLQREELIQIWYDRAIGPGEEWKVQIGENLELADIILLLVSAYFMASDYCHEEELKRALERHENKVARLIPIIVSDVSWESSLFAKLQALPKDGKAVELWENKNSAWKNIAAGIERVARELKAAKELKAPCVWVVVFSGTVPDDRKPQIEVILEHLRKVSDDPTLTLRQIKSGSIILVLEGTYDGFERVSLLWKSGDLRSIEGFSIESIELSLGESVTFRKLAELKERISSELSNDKPMQSSPSRVPSSELDSDKDKSMQPSPSRVPFTNREDEMKNILSSTAPAYHLLYAPAGCGKTELLKQLKQRFKERGWHYAYVALSVNSSDKDLANELAKQLNIPFSTQDDTVRPSRQLGSGLQKKWQSKDKKKGVVLLIDIEKIPSIPILHKLIESFIPDIQGSLRGLVDFASKHNRFRVIIAGRSLATHLEAKHHNLPLNLLRLSPFDYDVIRNSAIEYLPDFDQPVIDQLSAHLFFLTGGHPGCIAHTLEMYKEKGMPPDEFLEDYGNTIWQGVVRDCVESILGEIPDSHGYLRISLERMSVFRFLDYSILKELNEGLIPEILDEYQLADALTARYLLDWKGRFLRDEIARRLLTIKLRNETPNEFPKRCEQAMGICADRLRQSNVSSPETWTIEYLYQLLQCHANGIQEPEHRMNLRDNFPEHVRNALGIFYNRNLLGEKWRGEKAALMQAMKDDWEFQFTVNYYLRDNNYNENPYHKMMQQIDKFFA